VGKGRGSQRCPQSVSFHGRVMAQRVTSWLAEWNVTLPVNGLRRISFLTLYTNYVSGVLKPNNHNDGCHNENLGLELEKANTICPLEAFNPPIEQAIRNHNPCKWFEKQLSQSHSRHRQPFFCFPGQLSPGATAARETIPERDDESSTQKCQPLIKSTNYLIIQKII